MVFTVSESGQKLISAHFNLLHRWLVTQLYSKFDVYVSDNNSQLQLWIHFEALWNDIRVDVVTMSTLLFSPQTENDLREVWNKTGHQGNNWNRAEIPLRKLRNFKVIFEGIRSRDVSGGASLDDLEFIDCAPSKWCDQYAHFVSNLCWL